MEKIEAWRNNPEYKEARKIGGKVRNIPLIRHRGPAAISAPHYRKRISEAASVDGFVRSKQVAALASDLFGPIPLLGTRKMKCEVECSAHQRDTKNADKRTGSREGGQPQRETAALLPEQIMLRRGDIL
jgi:hypothetical protein